MRRVVLQRATIGDRNVWTFAQAMQVPQTDCMGKNAVWRHISPLLIRDEIPFEKDDIIDITGGAMFPWWLWVANLGQRTREVIGEGIQAVHLSRTLRHEVVFKFSRVDNTQVFLLLGCRQSSESSEVYTRYR